MRRMGEKEKRKKGRESKTRRRKEEKGKEMKVMVVMDVRLTSEWRVQRKIITTGEKN